jgi:hypothetical protein
MWPGFWQLKQTKGRGARIPGGVGLGHTSRESVGLAVEVVGVALAFNWKVVRGRVVVTGILAVRVSLS